MIEKRSLMIKQINLFLLLGLISIPGLLYAEPSALFVSEEGKVGINIGENTDPIDDLHVKGGATIQGALTLEPQQEAPENPSTGSMYLSSDLKLHVFLGEWKEVQINDIAPPPEPPPSEPPASVSPIVHFPMNENNANYTYDIIGSVIGTLNGGSTWFSDEEGVAIGFGGQGDRVNLSPSVDLGEEWTLSAWFSGPLPNTVAYHTLFRGYAGDHPILTNPSLDLGTYASNGSSFYPCGYNLGSLSSGWHHIVAVGSGGQTEFFIDGVSVGVSQFKSTTEVSVINNYMSGSQLFANQVNDVKIYDIALSAAQVAELFAVDPENPSLTPPAPPAEEGLIAYFNLDEGSGTTVSGNSYTAILKNITWDAGYSGTAAIYSGQSSVISLDTQIDLDEAWTLAARFKMPLATGTWKTLFRGKSSDYQIIVDANQNLGAYLDFNGGFYSSGFDMSVLSDGWHQLVAVGNNGETEYFVDGVSVGTIAAKSTSDVYFIGNKSSSQQFSSAIDDVRIYNVALTAQEVADLEND